MYFFIFKIGYKPHWRGEGRTEGSIQVGKDYAWEKEHSKSEDKIVKGKIKEEPAEYNTLL